MLLLANKCFKPKEREEREERDSMKKTTRNILLVSAALFVSACGQPKTLNVTGVEPAAGFSTGGVVRVLGTGLQSDAALGAQVYFGDQQARVIEIHGDSEIVVEAPSGPAKTAVDVKVIFDDGREFQISKGYFYKEPLGTGFNVDAITLK